MERVMQPVSAQAHYSKALFWSVILIVPFAFIQLHLIQDDFQAIYWAVPLLEMLVLAGLWGRVTQLNAIQKRESILFKAVVDFSLEFTYVRTVAGEYEYVSPAVQGITGYSPEDFYKTPSFMDAIIYAEDRGLWASHVHNMNDEGAAEKVEFRITTKHNKIRWMEHLCGPVHNSAGDVIGVRSINIDITERKRVSEKLEHLGFYDPLTDLPNRRFITDNMAKLIEENEEAGLNECFSVFFIDLNRFKYVNDAYGHSVGDALLQEVARRFKNSCLTTQKAMVARFGGDEFVVINKLSVNTDSIQECVARMNQLLEAPFLINGHRLSIGATAGVAVYPRDGVTPEVLIQHADAAMYKAKSQGLSMAFFSQEMAEHATEMVDLQNRLRGALNRGLIQPYYQPLVDLKTGKMIGVEVLARWIPDDGSIAPTPSVFIPVSEETGLIWALSEAMISQASKHIVEWQDSGIDIKYSVNVSARQFSDDNFCDRVISQFETLGIRPESVQIELTESILLDNIERSLEKIQQLKAKGFTIALDDFGTGFASLHYLTLFPLDTLKVDRAFVINIIEDKRQFAIAKSIINLAHDLDLVVVAEGIETEEQRQVLFDLGCDIGQGYLFSRPVPPCQLTALLAA
jgi:diguanylate cyclase (GGDEF)-like protein/PAS domain S-box-containing protein